MLDDYSSSYGRIFEKSDKFSMDVKRKHKLCIEIYESLNNFNPSFIKGIFELSLCFRPVYEQYKLNLNIPGKKYETFRTKGLGSLGPKIWYNTPYNRKFTENLNVCKGALSGLRQFLAKENFAKKKRKKKPF